MPDIRSERLHQFVTYAQSLRGDEKGEAQVFLDRLFRGFGHEGYKEAGATLEDRVKSARGGTGFADLVWKPIVLIEMKKRGEDLTRHLQQAFDYWVRLVPNRPKYVVLCNFDEFRIYDFDVDLNEPQDTVTLAELPDRYTPLNFLFKLAEKPIFRIDREKVTREAADLLAAVYRRLAALRDRLTTLRILDPACGSGNFLYIAYREMRRLEVTILNKLAELSKQATLGRVTLAAVSPRQFFGMDILPFAVELAKVTLALAPKLAADELHSTEPPLPLQNLDTNIRVEDALIQPDGSRTAWPAADIIIGNPPFLGAKRFKPERGADYVNAVRMAYAEVPGMADYCVYWFRHAHDHLPAATPANPFAGLVGTQNIRNNQSRVGGLDHIAKSGVIVEAVENQPWSGEANVHVSIANWVKTGDSKESHERKLGSRSFPSAQPAGLKVNSRGRSKAAAGGKAPPPGKTAKKPPHPEGVQPKPVNEPALLIPSPRRLWSKVDPKLALFDQDNANSNPKVVTTGKRGRIRQDKSYEMAMRECAEINSTLSDELDVSGAEVVSFSDRESLCYTGQYPRYEGFMLTAREAKQLFKESEANHEVVHPFLVGRELLDQWGGCDRFVIDFQTAPLLTAKKWNAPFGIVERKVLPYVQELARKERIKTGLDKGQDQTWLKTWWQHFRPRPELIGKVAALSRYIVCSRVTKRPVFVFLSPKIRPGDALSCFVFDDDYSFSILQSDTHWQWFIAKCSKLKSDFRYTPESVFDTFPWPQSPTKKQIRAVAAAGRQVRAIRAKALPTIKGGLRALYRTLELPGENPLKAAHAALDAAVLDAYGFDPAKDLLKQLLDLNLAVARAIDKGDQVTAPGAPPVLRRPRRPHHRRLHQAVTHNEGRRVPDLPPASHFACFTKICRCKVETMSKGRVAALVRFLAQNTRAMCYTYRCVACGANLTQFIPHKLTEQRAFVDLDAWCVGHREWTDAQLAKRFTEIDGVLRPAMIVPPAVGEVAPGGLLNAKSQRFDYYVDESGNPEIITRGGRVIEIREGNSRTFMLGAAVISAYAELGAALAELRAKLIADPQFKNVPSFDPARNKTARLFHASKDLAPVREQVFALLDRYPVNVFVVFRRKQVMIAQALAAAKGERPTHSWQQEYDGMAKRLFRDRLHLANESRIIFARRGNADRQKPLTEALEYARREYEKKWGKVNPHTVVVESGQPDDVIGLQVVDYYLWALSRALERSDYSYFMARRDAYRLIIDADDHRRLKSGTYYTVSEPLSPDKLMPFEG